MRKSFSYLLHLPITLIVVGLTGGALFEFFGGAHYASWFFKTALLGAMIGVPCVFLSYLVAIFILLSGNVKRHEILRRGDLSIALVDIIISLVVYAVVLSKVYEPIPEPFAPTAENSRPKHTFHE